MSEGKSKGFNDGKSWTFIKVYACADDTDTEVQKEYRSFIPDTTGTVTVRFSSGGDTQAIPVVAGGIYPIADIYSFDSTNTDSTNVVLLK